MSDLEDYNNIIVDIPHMREIYNSFESERNKFTCAISDLELKLVKLNAARNIAAQCLEDSGHEWRMNYVTKNFEWVHKDTFKKSWRS